MYIEKSSAYYSSSGVQHSRKAKFLILVQSDALPLDSDNFRALIRVVALKAFGPWMTGTARAFGERITISGAYGNNGLPVTVPHHIFERAIPVPLDLYIKWDKGGGHNTCGTEHGDMRTWALQQLGAANPIEMREGV